MSVSIRDHNEPGFRDASMRQYISRTCELCEKGAHIGPPHHLIVPVLMYSEYCDYCDGCGWYEGGATLQTKCQHCNGTGIVTKRLA